MASVSWAHPRRLHKPQKSRTPLIFKGFPGLFCIKVERVLDPCCGSGGMFVQSAKFVENHGGNINRISVFGQDSNPTT